MPVSKAKQDDTRRTPAPENHEQLTKAIHDRYDGLSRSYRQIARYLTQNPNDVAIQSINAIAVKCGVHASSLVRFAQLFGYQGFKELQILFQDRLATAAPGFEARVDAIKSELSLHARPGMSGFLGDLVARDISSLHGLLEDTDEADFTRAIDLLERAETVYLAGQLRSAPVALFLQYVLTMLRRRVVLLDANGGLATEMAKAMGPTDLLLATSFRYYAKEVVTICETAQSQGVPVIAISDSSLSPLAKTAEILFAIPEDEYSFSRSLAAPMCLAQALMIALAARFETGPDAPDIPILSRLKNK